MNAYSDEPLDEREFPDEQDMDACDDESPELAECPNCHLPIFEDAEQCPHCHEWIVSTSISLDSSRKWYMRLGYWAAKTLLLNWIFWIGMSVLGLLLWLLGR